MPSKSLRFLFFKPLEPGDVPASHADVHDLITDFQYAPETDLRTGVKRFLEWYIEYYKLNIKLRD